jgi:hypothetical protein
MVGRSGRKCPNWEREGFVENFRMVIKTEGKDHWVSLRADMPESKGLSYLWFVLSQKEFLALLGNQQSEFADGYHRLQVQGDAWTFYDLEIPLDQSGKAEIRYYNLTLPRRYLRVLGRYVQAVWKSQTKAERQNMTHHTDYDGKVEVDLKGPLSRALTRYGHAKGGVRLDADQETKDKLENIALYSNGRNFSDCLTRLNNIARGSTQSVWQQARLSLSSDGNGFVWTAFSPKGTRIMNGGLFYHSDADGGEWSIHT